MISETKLTLDLMRVKCGQSAKLRWPNLLTILGLPEDTEILYIQAGSIADFGETISAEDEVVDEVTSVDEDVEEVDEVEDDEEYEEVEVDEEVEDDEPEQE